MSDELNEVASDAPVSPVVPSPGEPAALSADIPVKIAPTVWSVIVPHCPLGRVRIKGETAAEAEAKYRSIAGDDCNPKIPARVEIA